MGRIVKTLEDLQVEVEKADGLILGYLGNLEHWGDDRRWYIWSTNLWEENGNKLSLWSCESRDFDNKAYYQAKQKMHMFQLGRESVLKSIGEI